MVACWLTVHVSDPRDGDLTVSFYGRKTTPLTPGPDFTLIATAVLLHRSVRGRDFCIRVAHHSS
jgi:hypothetical protein